MDYHNALQKLGTIDQQHLLNFFDDLKPQEKKLLLAQIEQLQIEIFKKQQKAIFKDDPSLGKIEPLTKVSKASDLKDDSAGIKLLQDGKVGCLLVAGGQGTRLQFQGPKGTFLVSAVKKKSLFQIFSEKVLACEKQIKRSLPVAIMTSEENDKETKDFFKKHDFFGLSPDQISFFSQSNLPFLDVKGNLFLENPYTIAKGPDGNGSSLQTFFNSGIWQDWHKKGISFVHYVLVDNPLEKPFDPELLSFQSGDVKDVIIKCVKRENPKESVGILVNQAGNIKVVEYSEITDDERLAKDSHGNLKHGFANISLFLFSMDFIQRIALNEKNAPLHKAFKAVSYLDEAGKTQISKVPNSWKFEKFIFDVLPFAKGIEVVEYTRKQCFSPLKNLHGDQSLEMVQADMQNLDYETMKKITGRDDPILTPFEIAQEFYYPTKELVSKWENRAIPKEHYIES